MIDIRFHNMLTQLYKYHEDINNYNKYKNLTKADIDSLFYDILSQFKITIEQYSILNIYLKLSYLYFANYSQTKVEKQTKQIMSNTKTIAIDAITSLSPSL
jgi:hypothetical protein